MRRLVVGLSTVLLLIAGFPPAAQADSTVLVTGHGTGEFDYFEGTSAWAAGFNCEVFPVQGQAFFRVEQDTPPPPLGLGTRSWGFTPQFGATGRFYGVGVDVASSSGLDNFGMQVYGAAPSTGRAMIFAVPPGTITNGYYLGTATVGGGGDAWTPVNAANLSYAWAEYNSESTPTGVSGGTKTLDAFVTATGESTAGYRGILGFGCDGETFLYDGFKYGAAGSVTTLDFEAFATHLTIDATKKTIVAGKSTAITGSVDARYIPSTPVDLEVKKFGSDTFTKVTTVQAPQANEWTLTKSVAPTKQATYRWHFLETEVNAEGFSGEVVINVKTAITASIADKTLNRGQNLVVTGKTTPKKPGVTLKLWRKTSTGAIVLGTTTVESDGSYRIAYPVNARGTWKVYTTVPAGSGNLAGKSPIREATVS